MLGTKTIRTKIKNPLQIYAAEPKESAVLSGEPMGPHKIIGMGPGFVPDILDRSLFEGIIKVPSDEAIAMARRLAKEEGLMTGW